MSLVVECHVQSKIAGPLSHATFTDNPVVTFPSICRNRRDFRRFVESNTKKKSETSVLISS